MAECCCLCNGNRARCIRCSCVQNHSLCVSCVPKRLGNCHNLPSSSCSGHGASPMNSSSHSSSKGSPSPSQGSVPVTSSHSSPQTTASSLTQDQSNHPPYPTSSPNSCQFEERPLDSRELRDLMVEAYGLPFASTMVTDSSDWAKRWNTVIHLSGSHYSLPRGPVGRRYVTLLTEEIQHLTQKLYSSERLIVFSSVILQRNKIVKKTRDIKDTLERRLSLWCDEKYDILVQEAVRCDHPFQRIRQGKPKSDDHITKVFSRLMLQGKVRAAMHWLSGESRGRVLCLTDTVQLQPDGPPVSVIDALRSKHPPQQPPIPHLFYSILRFHLSRTLTLLVLMLHMLPTGFKEVEVLGGVIHFTGRMPCCVLAHTVPVVGMQ